MTYLEFKDIIGKYQNISRDTLVKLENSYGKQEIYKHFDKFLIDTEISEKERMMKSSAYLEELSNAAVVEKVEDMGIELDPTDPVKIYLTEIGRYPLLTPEEEKDLFTKLVIVRELADEENYRDSLERLIELGFDNNIVVSSQEDKMKYQIAYASELLLNSNSELSRELEYIMEQLLIEKKYKDLENDAFNANARLAVSMSKKYVGNGLSFLDLIQEANEGLIKAISKFDPKKGYKFSTYATWWIKQAITRAIADQSRTIRVPVHFHESVILVKKTDRYLTEVLFRDPTDEDVLEFFRNKSIEDLREKGIFNPTEEEIFQNQKIKPDRLAEVRKIMLGNISLNTPVGEDEDSVLADFIPDDEQTVEESAEQADTKLRMINEISKSGKYSLKEVIVISLRSGLKLSDYVSREDFVYSLRNSLSYEEAINKYDYFDEYPSEHTLEEIGELYNLTRERIRQIESKIKKKLVKNPKIKALR